MADLYVFSYGKLYSSHSVRWNHFHFLESLSIVGIRTELKAEFY